MLARLLYPLLATLITGRLRNPATAGGGGMGAASALTGTEGISRERSRFSRECRAELREQDGGGGG